MDHRPLDVRESIGGEIPPLHQEDPAPRRLEVVVDRNGQRRRVAAVPVHGDEVPETVVDE
jgi:hypothetical protein